MKEVNLKLAVKETSKNGIDIKITYKGDTRPAITISGNEKEKAEVFDMLTEELKFIFNHHLGLNIP